MTFPSRNFVRRLAFPLAMAGLAGCAGSASDATRADSVSLDAIARASNVQAFDEVWSTIDSTYFDPARLGPGKGNVDWNAARRTLRPRVERAATLRQARDAMNALLDRLNETHFAIIPAELFQDASQSSHDEKSGSVGITIRMIDGEAVVWRVNRGSSAAMAGVRPGWILDQAGQTKVSALLAERPVPASTTRPSSNPGQRDVQNLLDSAPGGIVDATFTDSEGERRDFDLKAASNEADFAQLGSLPTMSLRVDAVTLAGDVGYFSLSSFLDPPRVMPAFDTFIRDHAHSPGIVIDLRGNPGGLSSMATGLAGYFVRNEDVKLGSMITRSGTLNFNINPRRPTFDGKVAVLIDGSSASTSEIFAAGLQDLGRARVFGGRSEGAALPSTLARLSNGDRLQFAVADCIRINGQRIEGNGVTPDEVTPLKREDLLAGRDAPLEAAMLWIQSGAITKPTTNPVATPDATPEPN